MSSAGLGVRFNVHCHFIRQFESIFVVGNAAELGAWNPDKAVELEKDKVEGRWSATVKLVSSHKEPLKFRYFIGYYLQSTNDPASKLRIVSRWEAQRVPRSLIPPTGSDVLVQNHEFGTY
uniref:CBM20 domain-containing protein n=2 Tax=Bursaphelenchus xylophilus TaxID=6326 RepID=A0A1I7SH89_BURXY